jgi:hypothetical protein
MQTPSDEKQRVRLSPCCNADLVATSGDGVIIGMCSACFTPLVRIHPLTGEEERLDGRSPWVPNLLQQVQSAPEESENLGISSHAWQTSQDVREHSPAPHE